MKLGKPKRYTFFRNASDMLSSVSSSSTGKCNNNSPVIITMANSSHSQNQSSLVTSMSSWLLVPRGRNFRHILATVLCVILVYHITLLAIPTQNSGPSSSSPSNGAESSSIDDINSFSAAAAAELTLCVSCEDNHAELDSYNQISQPQNDVNNEQVKREIIPIVGTSSKTGSQAKHNPHVSPEQAASNSLSHQSNVQNDNEKTNFASPPPPQQQHHQIPTETSGSNYNYYYTDEVGNKESHNYDTAGNGLVVNSDNDNSANEVTDDKNLRSIDDNQSIKAPARGKNAPSQTKTIPNANKNVAKFDKRANTKLLFNTQYQKRRKLLDSIFFSIKSTKRFHKTRLGPVISTWFNLAKDQTWIFTDDDDPELNAKTNGHVIHTHCPSTHYRQALCCKMSAEFDTFIKSQKSWFCHFDDDNYVNVPALLDMLSKYDHKEDWYLGKPSLKIPIKIPHPDNKSEEISFWFATGGAGFCLSRALAKRMSPVASGGKFTKLCDSIQLPDDVTIGYIAGHLLGRNLTVIPQFHSHYETMRFLDMKNPYPEITFSYVRYWDNSLNTLEIDGFSEEEDPTRFMSLHCLLFPNFSFCPKAKKK